MVSAAALRVLGGIISIALGAKAVREGIKNGRTQPASDELRAGPVPGGAGVNASLEGVRDLDGRMVIILRLIREGRIDPEVRAWTASVLTKKCRGANGETWCVAEKDRSAEIIAIFNAVRERVRYTGDVWSTDTYVAARHTLKQRIADCDDFTILGCAALGTVGIRTKPVVIQTKNGEDWDHIYLLADDGKGGWVPFDASVAEPCGWEAPANFVRRKRMFQT